MKPDIDLSIWRKRLNDHKPLLVKTTNLVRRAYINEFNVVGNVDGSVVLEIKLAIVAENLKRRDKSCRALKLVK